MLTFLSFNVVVPYLEEHRYNVMNEPQFPGTGTEPGDWSHPRYSFGKLFTLYYFIARNEVLVLVGC